MKCALVFVAVVLVSVVTASPLKKDDTKKGLQNKPCLKSCDLDYAPICAGEGKDKPKSFGSMCVLENHNCEQSTNLKKLSDGECPGGGGVRLS